MIGSTSSAHAPRAARGPRRRRDDPRSAYSSTNAIGNAPLIDVDMGYMLGVTENVGIGIGAITSLQGTQLSENVALEGKFGVAVTGMYTGLPVLVRGRLYAAGVFEGEGGNVAAAAQGGNVNVYFHLADEILEGDIGPFATAGYEVDRTNVDTTIFRLNVALGCSFL